MSDTVTLPQTLTYGAMLDIARKVETREAGEALVAALVARARDEDRRLSEAEADFIVRSNLGYMAGYCDVETQRRFERMFSAVHPVFGPVGGDKEPKTAEEAFRMGVAAAQGGRDE